MSLPHSRRELGLEATLSVQDLEDLTTIDAYPVHGLWQQNLVRPDSAGPTLPPHPVAVAACREPLNGQEIIYEHIY